MFIVVAVASAACGSGVSEQAPRVAGGTTGSGASVNGTAPADALAPSGVNAGGGGASVAGGAARAPTAEDVFGRLQPALAACYAGGRKNAPAMSDGKLSLLASVDALGKPSCVIPADDTGLSQEVEDCMRARFAEGSYARGAPFALELPIVVAGGAVTLRRAAPTAPTLDTIESHGVRDAEDVLQKLLPELDACMSSLASSSALRVVHVGARIGATGRVDCALATSSSPLPASVRDCSVGVLSRAVFARPEKGVGFVSVPLKVLGTK